MTSQRQFMKDCKHRIVLDSDIFFQYSRIKKGLCVAKKPIAMRILISGPALNEIVDRFFVF